MTTNYGQNGSNPMESTTPIYGITQVGVTADVGLMNLATNTEKSRAAIPVDRPEEGMWDIGMGDIILAKNEEVFRKLFKLLTQLTGDRTYGKALGVGQTGNLPVSDDLLNDAYYKAAPKEEQERMRRRFILSYMHFVGISQDSWRKAKGPDKTPDQDGLMVIIHGLVSVQLFTERPLRPGALLVLDLIPTQQVGRAGSTRYVSQGPERYPATMREHDPHSPTEWIRKDGLDLLSRLNDIKNGGKNAGTRILNVVSRRDTSAHLLLEGQRNSAQVLTGIAGIICRFLLDPSVAGLSTTEIVDKLLTGVDAENHDGSPSKAGKPLDKFIDESQQVVMTLGHATFHDSHNSLKNPRIENKPLARTLLNNSLELFLYGAQDTAAITNKIIGRNIQTLLPKHNKSASGVYTDDVFVYA